MHHGLSGSVARVWHFGTAQLGDFWRRRGTTGGAEGGSWFTGEGGSAGFGGPGAAQGRRWLGSVGAEIELGAAALVRLGWLPRLEAAGLTVGEGELKRGGSTNRHIGRLRV
jgi:hypothetical protein